jgi:uracil-DNA glycosylase
MKSEASEFNRVVSEIQTYLAFLKVTGCAGVDLGEKSQGILKSWGVDHFDSRPIESLSEVFNQYLSCKRCGLSENRRGSVFGAGPQDAKLMFIGFIPENGDEKTGQPYTREQGALLTNIIAAMQCNRNSVYICHTVKCLPRDERAPNRYEIKACRYHLVRQIQAIRPGVICVMGQSAANALFGVDTPIERMRGKFHDYHGIPVMPTFDLAHLLAHPPAKRATWEDVQKVMEKLDDMSQVSG